MSNEFNVFDISISTQELEQRIKEYWLNLDESINEVNVEYSSKWIKGEYNYAWQYNMGGRLEMKVKVKIVRQIKILGEIRNVEDNEYFDKDGILHLLCILLKKDNLKATWITQDMANKNTITITCEKLTKDDEKNQNNKSLKKQLVK